MRLAFAPASNTEGKKDATGAFHPEARAWAQFVGEAEVVRFDNTRGKVAQRSAVLSAICDAKNLSHLAFFCHGWTNGIQPGITTSDLNAVAAAVELASPLVDLVVTLYCCSTGGGGIGGDGGFADEFRDALCRRGVTRCVIDAHVTPGHTTQNPHVRRFTGAGTEYGGAGGQWIVSPGSRLWPRWRGSLQRTDLRFEFPTLSIEQIHARLAG